ncbi:DUF308 domain-containing protein [Elizabethkingia meningoseptica]|uniref:HdeD family acid-resistance protein n=1 Tax=Elizabethkingia meningoseptica TaxID=238 RepID=UPI000999EBC9|nr:DUF308 domain-containing protein [Elizabethkingia meningoseptica]MCL1674561.1 DUF308 domain-containing protein [Elizabethkingia meningoseptica]MCL1686240.1 DUF308 domain-containing protein [Elizabethkingia meningoseptica]MDE5467775.1 DUF308 domain-containing protein [Elizabethkingia meningoseptica]MDE5474694.1 DUF308 domain-containing protein [Elizabethkingia meningoseptica]MDE5478127.1 DUF308 domain-containing protein [Elizabethkingia meningoseptica]
MDNDNNPAKLWFLPLLTGIIFILVGFWIFKTPMESYLTLSIFFAVTFLISGLFEIIHALSNTHLRNWGWSLAGGIIDLLFGIIMLSSPTLSATVLALYVGFIILFRSFMSIGFALNLREFHSRSWGSPLIFGILGVIFAILIIINPALGGLTIIFYTALAFILVGILQILFAFMIKKLKR